MYTRCTLMFILPKKIIIVIEVIYLSRYTIRGSLVHYYTFRSSCKLSSSKMEMYTGSRNKKNVPLLMARPLRPLRKNDTSTATARCEMQKKAEMESQDVTDAMRPKMMHFPFKPREQKLYWNIFSLLLFPRLAWVTPNISWHFGQPDGL